MPSTFSRFAWSVDADARLAYARLWGTVTGRDMLDVAEAVHGDPAWQDGFDAVWDCSGVTAHVVAIEEVQPLVDEEADSGPGQDALVENEHLSDAAISAMLAAFCRRRGKAVTVHPTLDAALAALGRAALPASLQSVQA